jgi:hypothetical protein
MENPRENTENSIDSIDKMSNNTFDRLTSLQKKFIKNKIKNY